MASINNNVFDSGLNYAATGPNQTTTVYINSQEPTNFAEATTTYALGNVAVGSKTVADGTTGGGRQLNYGAVSNGTVTAGTPTSATHASAVNGSELLFTTSIVNPQQVSSGQTFDLNAWFAQFKDPT